MNARQPAAGPGATWASAATLPEPASVAGERYPERQCTLWADKRGVIVDCCEHAAAAFGYRPHELQGLHVSVLVPALADTDLLTQGMSINPRLAFKCRYARFRAVGRNGKDEECALFLNVIGTRGCPILKIILVGPLGPQSDHDSDGKETPEKKRAPAGARTSLRGVR
jgi:hypothetical protein